MKTILKLLACTAILLGVFAGIYGLGFKAGRSAEVANKYINAVVVEATEEGYNLGLEKAINLRLKRGV